MRDMLIEPVDMRVRRKARLLLAERAEGLQKRNAARDEDV